MMEFDGFSSRQRMAAKTLSLLTVLGGCLLLLFLVPMLRSVYFNARVESRGTILFISSLPVLLFMGFLLYTAWRLWSEISLKTVRLSLLGCSILLFALLPKAFAFFDYYILRLFYKGIRPVSTYGFLSFLLAALFYWKGCRLALGFFGIEDLTFRQKAESLRVCLGGLSFFFGFACCEWLRIHMGLQGETALLGDKGRSVLFGSIAAAILFYNLSMHLIVKRPLRRQTAVTA